MAATKFKTAVELQAALSFSSLTANRVVYLNASKELSASSVTDTELGYLSGVSSAIQTQINAKISSSEKGAANGVAPLNGSSKIDASYLPSYVDDVLEYANLAALPGTGETGKIYVTLDNNKTFRWTGSVYVEISPSEVNSVNGATGIVVLDSDDISEGSSNLYFTNARAKSAAVSDDVYGAGWNGVTDVAPSKNAVYDKIESVAATSDLKDLKVSANDSTAGYLEGKIVGASGKISISTLNDGGDEDLQITIGADVFDKTSNTSDNISEGSTNLFFSDERAQDAIGSSLTDSSSIDFTYNDGANTITAVVLPAGVDHDSLSNFVANEHIDHSAVSVVLGGEDGLSASNNSLASNIGLKVDINGTSAVGSLANADEVMIYDISGSSLAKTTISDIRKHSSGDILETSFSGAESASSVDVTGFAFANGTVRSFKALVSVSIDATSDLFEAFELIGIQKGASWDLAISSVGDDSLVSFSITTAGQIKYSSSTYAGFASMSIKFKAYSTSV